MAYGAILSVACVLLTLRYAFIGSASVASRVLVGGISIASFLIAWRIPAVVMQLGASLYVLLYLQARAGESDIRLR